MKYVDGLGHKHDVDAKHVEEFERRRTVLLCIKIAILLTALSIWLYFIWS